MKMIRRMICRFRRHRFNAPVQVKRFSNRALEMRSCNCGANIVHNIVTVTPSNRKSRSGNRKRRNHRAKKR